MSSIQPPLGMTDSSPPERSYACGVCPMSFRRREHFERHLKGHSKGKDFKCDVCNKEFARRDTLQRHAALHGQTPTKVQKTLPRAARACLSCMKSKQRCSGSQPCDRCNRKQERCQFPRGAKDMLSSPHGRTAGREAYSNSNHDTSNFNDDHQSEIFNAWALSPIDSTHANPSGPDSVGGAAESYADLAFSGQLQPPPGNGELASTFDSYLLWPLDTALDATSLPTSLGAVEPGNGPIGMQFAVDEHQGQANEPSGLDGGQLYSSTYMSGANLLQDDHDTLIAEDYRHVPKPSIETYERMCNHFAEMRHFSPDCVMSTLYPLEVLHVCVQLYFEHFHPSFPVLHQGSFEPRSSSWLLYIAVAAVGSQYSRLSGRNAIFVGLMKAIRVCLLQKLSSGLPLKPDLELAQGTLLFNISLLFGGSREGVMHLQYQRNMLVTMCRPLLVHGILFAKSGILSDKNPEIQDWTKWVTAESWSRLVYFTWLNECFQLVLFDLPPLFSPGEMHMSMPCNYNLWQCTNVHDWERMKASQEDPGEVSSVSSLLKTKIIDQKSIRSFSSLALWISISAVYVSERHYAPAPSFCSHISLGTNSNLTVEDERSPSRGFPAVSPIQNIDLVDSILTSIQHISEHRQDSPICLTITKFSLIFKLLRFIEYRLLYISSGWMAKRQEMESVCQYITQLFKLKPKQTRQALVHAAQLFRLIRSQHQFDPYDSFFLLMATLYIWNYDRFVTSAISQPTAAGATGAEAIIRVDQNTIQDLVTQWIAGTMETPSLIHISGLGVLNGQDSVQRILRESSRILGHDKAWATMAHAIKSSLVQMVSGAPPSFATDVDRASESVI